MPIVARLSLRARTMPRRSPFTTEPVSFNHAHLLSAVRDAAGRGVDRNPVETPARDETLGDRRRAGDVTGGGRQRRTPVERVGPRRHPELDIAGRQTATLKFAERTTDGWSSARVVASGTDWFVNWAGVPSVVRLADGALVAHSLQKSGSRHVRLDVRLAHSKNEGKTWSSSFTPHSDGTKTEHGFASLFQMPGAGLGPRLAGRSRHEPSVDARCAQAMRTQGR